MPRENILDKLQSGALLVMDGGTGSEIQARGADVLKGVTVESGLQAWSATANIEYANVVQQVHQDYLRVGADILVSNNFWTSPSRLESIGLSDVWERYALAGAENAIKARDNLKPEAYVAGGVAPPCLQHKANTLKSDVEIMGHSDYHSEIANHASLLADAGVDFLLPEYVGFIDDCVEAVDACAETRLPILLGVRHLQQNGLMQYGETVEGLVEALNSHRVDGILLMCATPEAISATLPRLRAAYDGPVGAYPNIGYRPTGLLGGPDRKNFMNVTTYSPARLGEFCLEWKDMGAQIMGGCCGTGPEHILMSHKMLRE